MMNSKTGGQAGSRNGPGALDRAARALFGSLKFRPLIYGYANARVHALASKFLTPAQMQELIRAGNTQEIVEMLERGIYKEDLVALSLKFKGEDLVELATSRHFSKFAKALLKLTPRDGQGIVQAMLSRWDAHNVKTVLLARAQGKRFEDIEPYLVIAGTLDGNDLRGLLEAKDPDAFLIKLGVGGFGGALIASEPGQKAYLEAKKRLREGGGEKALSTLHDALDAYPFGLAGTLAVGQDRDSKQVKKLLDRLADEKNLSTVMRLSAAGEKPSAIRKYLVDGGTIGEREWSEIAKRKDSQDMLGKLKRKLPLSGALEEYRQTGRLSMLEVALAQNTAREGLKAFTRSGLGVGVIVGALLLKEQEMANIRKLMRGRALGLGEKEIMKILVLAKKE